MKNTNATKTNTKETTMNVDFAKIQKQAKTMTDEELAYAKQDAYKAAQALKGAEVSGKDENYYMDVYWTFLYEENRRRKEAIKAENRIIESHIKDLKAATDSGNVAAINRIATNISFHVETIKKLTKRI